MLISTHDNIVQCKFLINFLLLFLKDKCQFYDKSLQCFIDCFDIFSQDHAEDRLFSTAVSVNALINTWTTFENGTLHWETGMCFVIHQEIGICYVIH